MTFAKIGMTAALAAGLLISTSAFADALVEGTWLTPDQAEMTIEECEQGLCGTLSKIVITQAHVQQYGVDASAIDIESITDVMNKDPAMRERPMLGLQILTLKATDNPWHFTGDIYNP